MGSSSGAQQFFPISGSASIDRFLLSGDLEIRKTLPRDGFERYSTISRVGDGKNPMACSQPDPGVATRGKRDRVHQTNNTYSPDLNAGPTTGATHRAHMPPHRS